MRRKTKWIALGLVVAMCATATVGAVSMAEEQSDPAETVSAEEAVEAEAPEADVTDEEIQETEAAEEVEETAEDSEAEGEETEATEDTDAEAEEAAEEDIVEYVAIPYDTEDVWGQVAITNSDLVDTALNIRSTADEDGDIVGFLYKGAAAWVIDQGDEWTEIYSNGLTGYVLNEYLLFGDDVGEIADFYSVKGVRADWDGVTVYSSTEDLTEMGEMNTGDSYPVIDDEDDHWVEIQFDEDETGYVSADDVSFVMLFESATPKDGERLELTEDEEESTEEESETEEEAIIEDAEEDDEENEDSSSEVVYEETYDGSEYYEETYVEEDSTSYYSDDSYSYDTYSDDSYSYSYSDDSYSYNDSYSYSESDSSSSSTLTEVEVSESSDTGETDSSGNFGGAYYDANTDTYYDENGNVVTSYAFYEDDDEDEYYEEEEIDEEEYTVYENESYVEDAYVEDYSEAVTYSSDDSTLMASLIYCEAGNQPYEGMVAVGAVVMNRVDSDSFPNTISDVVYQSGQFTPAYNGMLDSALSSGVGDVYYSAADDAMSGEDPTDGALYFNTSHGSGLKIGDHWFY